MALSCVLRPTCRHLCSSSALLSSLPGRDRSLLAEKKAAAKWKRKEKSREGCSLPGSSWEERYGFSKMTEHSCKHLKRMMEQWIGEFTATEV